MKYFCSKCGKTTLYNFELPKFCSFCGQSFTTNSTKPSETGEKFLNELKLKKINTINKPVYDQELESEIIEEDLVQSSIDFKKIKAKFSVDIRQNKGESFGSLIDNPASPPVTYDNSNIEKKTKNQILEEFQKEAGSLRSK